jgi:hypothetical protein
LRNGEKVSLVNELESHLRRFGSRLRLRDGWLLAQRTFWMAALGGVLIQIAGRIFPIYNLGFWTWLPFLVWLILVVLYSLIRPLPLMQIALKVDLELCLKERLSTALALQQVDATQTAKKQAFDRISLSTLKLTYLQRNDALSVAAKVIPAEAFAFSWLLRSLFIGAIFVSLILISELAYNPMDQIKVERAAIKHAAREQAQQIEKAKQEIEDSQEISEEMRQELISKMEELAKTLQQNPGNLEQALADLSKLEQELKSKLDPNLASRQSTLESLAAQLSQATGERNRQEATQASASLGQAVQSGNTQSVRNASQEAKAAITEMQTQMADQAALQQALTQANASKIALARTGRQIAQSSNGNSGQSNPGNNPGSEQTAGQQVSGGGTKANKLPPATGGKRPVTAPQGNAPNAPATLLESQVFAPWQKSIDNGSQIFIPGQETQQGETTTTESKDLLPGVSNPALIPYTQVYYNYMNTANQAIEQNYIPSNLVEYVRLYFSSLEP